MATLDAIDRRIIDLLRADVRRHNTDIARHVGLTEGAVRRRLERLLAEDIIHPTIHLNPARAGLVHAVIGLDIDLTRLDETAARIAALPEVTYAVLSTGPRDMLIMVMVHSQEALFAFIRDKLVQVPGVRDCETAITLKTIKLLSGEPTAAAPTADTPTNT